MSKPKNQHFVPKVYLKYFKINPSSNQNESVYILDTSNIYDKKPKSKSLNCAYFTRDKYYNSIDFEYEGYALEQELSKVENNYPSLMAAIEKQEQLSEKQKRDLLLFLTIAKLRSPIWRGAGYKHLQEIIKFTSGQSSESLTDESLKINHLKKLTDFTTMFQMSLNLCVKEWFVYQTNREHPFITSDNPGTSINLDDRIKIPNPYWEIKYDTILFFPLSATLCLIMGPFKATTPATIHVLNHPISYEVAQKKLVDKINIYTCATRNNLLISNSFDYLSKFNKKW